jgi:hypothetical protein
LIVHGEVPLVPVASFSSTADWTFTAMAKVGATELAFVAEVAAKAVLLSRSTTSIASRGFEGSLM